MRIYLVHNVSSNKIMHLKSTPKKIKNDIEKLGFDVMHINSNGEYNFVLTK